MRIIKPFLIILFLSITSCSGGSGDGSVTSVGASFVGIWFDDGIEEYRKNADPQWICNNREVVDGHNELRIDAYKINSQGHVSDFQFHRESPVLWKVRSDGSTYDNYILENKDHLAGAEDLVAHRMRKLNQNKIATIWTMKGQSGKLIDSELIYVRMSDKEVSKIKQILADCPNTP